MEIGWPQGIMLFLIVLSIGMEIAKHGEVKNQKHNAWSSLIAGVITIGLLYWGGFFK